MVITRLTQGKKRADRANVYLDEQLAFAVSFDVLLKWGLKKGLELSEEQVTEILGEDQISRAFDKAVNFLSYRPRSKKEVKDKLTSLDFAGFVVEHTLNKLENLELINDNEFAALWIQNRLTLKPKGKKALGLELKSKGISQTVIDTVLGTISTQEELEQAKSLVAKRRFESLSTEKREEKIKNFLLRRGYGWDIVKQVLKHLKKDI